MHAAFPRLILPARDRFYLRQSLERFEQRAAIHVFAYWKVEKREHSRRNVDQARAVDPFVTFDVWTGHDENAVLPMPGRWASWLARRPARTLRAGLKAMIGAKDNCCLRTGEIEQTLQ